MRRLNGACTALGVVETGTKHMRPSMEAVENLAVCVLQIVVAGTQNSFLRFLLKASLVLIAAEEP
jgi:hypothetical protein